MPKKEEKCPPLSEVDIFDHMNELYGLSLALDGPTSRFIKTFEPDRERQRPLAKMAIDCITFLNLWGERR